MKKHKTISVNERGAATVELRYKVQMPILCKDFVCNRLDETIPKFAELLSEVFSTVAYYIAYKDAKQKGGAK